MVQGLSSRAKLLATMALPTFAAAPVLAGGFFHRVANEVPSGE